ncbi:MAG TPA: M28 family peptidase [Vicinamibacterales bacterium]|nr:M28 family peptidase [Vicinamibacterales bacterium]
MRSCHPVLLLFAVVAFSPGLFAQVATVTRPQVDGAALEQTVRTLASPEFGGRRTGTEGNAKARALIVERFRSIGLQPLGTDYQTSFTFAPRAAAGATPTTADGVNVAAMCKGRGAADQGVMVISAHYDHLGTRDGAMYPGADDNASGVAVMLDLARHCRTSPWRHDAVFVAFDAEEQGLQGARAFVANPPIARERLAININMDMVSRSAKREVYLAGTHHQPALRPLLEPVAKRSEVNVLFGHDKPKDIAGGVDDWTPQSDHGAFHSAGIPFIYFGVEDHPDYHKPTDTADKIDMAFFAQVARTVLDAVTAVDGALPLRK